MPSGSSSGTTQQNVTQSSVPQEFYPYLTNIMGSAQSIATQPYQAYTGSQLSDFSNDTKQSFDMTRQNVGSWQPFTQTATNGLGTAMNSTQSIAQNGLNTPQVSTGQWNNQAAQNYMSPYLNQVLNSQQAMMNQQMQTQNANIASSAEQAGAYGGGRFAVAQAMNNNNYNLQLQQMQANTLNQGYTNAQNQFNADQSRDLTAQQTNAQNYLTGMNTQLNAANSLASQSGQMAGLGQSVQSMNATDAANLRNQGLQQEQLNQASLDLGYQNFENQQNWDKNNLAFESGLLHGLPVGGTVTQDQSTSVNPFSQMLGAGIGLSGLYSNMSGSSGTSSS